MIHDDLVHVKHYELPEGFSYVFWDKNNDLKEWINSH